MRSSRFLFRLLRFLILVLFAIPFAQAQVTNVTNETSTPIPGAGHDYIHLLSETVNPANGSVSLRIQVPTPRGRGITIPFSFAYDSGSVHHILPSGPGAAFWASNIGYLSSGGWSYVIPMASAVEADVTVLQYPNTYTCTTWANYMFRDLSGGQHALGLGTQYSSNVVSCPSGPSVSLSGDPQVQAFLPPIHPDPVYNPAATVYSPVTAQTGDGTVYYFNDILTSHPYSTGTSFLPKTIEDRNGNIVTVSDNSPNNTNTGSFAFTDSTGRQVISSSGYGPSGTTNTLTFSGLSYQVTWKTTTASFSVPSTRVANDGVSSCSTFPTASDSQVVVSKITLPNGQFYQFYYGNDNPDTTLNNPYGLLSEIIYPSGGWVKYTWKLSDTLNEFMDYPGSIPDGQGGHNPSQDGCLFEYKTPVVATRQVGFAGGSTASLTQSFSYNTNWTGAGTTWTSKTTSVTASGVNLPSTALTKYTYSSVPPPGVPFSYPSFPGQIPVESSTQYFDWGNTITPIRTINKTWQDVYHLASQQTMLDNGQTSKTTYSYVPSGSFLQPHEVDEYDYGLTSPSRKTITNYQAFTGAPGVISGVPCQVIIQDGSSNPLAETDSLYDGGTTVCGTSGSASTFSVSGLSPTTHDETAFAPGSATPRGNLTSVTRKCLQGCSTSDTSTYTYDETGQTLSVMDACGNATCSDMTGSSHTTNFSYADRYTTLSGGQNVTYSPSANTNAFLTQITNALGQTRKFTYDYNNGQLTVSQNQNDINAARPGTKYLYNDTSARPTLVNYPDGGQTTIAYNDAPYNPSTPSPSVTTTKAMTSTTNLTTLTAFDGLGHIVRSVLTSDPDCASGDRTDTTYDGFGRVHTVSNPYCTTGDSTYGLSTYTYDGLGRTTQVAHPDGTTVLTTYTGRATKVQDEGNGNGTQRVTRISQSDGLGRLLSLCEVAPGPFVGAGGSSTSSLIGSNGTPGSCGQDITAGNGFLTTYQYDVLSNLRQVNQSGVGSRTFAYDSLSRLLTATNPESGTIGYAYDANGNLTTKTAPAPNQTGSSTVTLLIGTQTIASTADSNSPGQAEAFQATAAASGQLASLTVYVDTTSTATQLIVGIYTDASGHPGTLLSQGSVSPPQAGAWNNVSISPVSLTQGTAYWIAILGSGGTLAFRDGSGCTSIGSSQTNLAALPATWSNGQSWPSCPLSTYGTTAPTQSGSTVTTTYQYDALNRLTQKSYSDGTTPAVGFSYDVPNLSWGCEVTTNGIGRLTSSIPWPHCYEYDSMGRMTYKDLRTPPNQLPRLFYAYDLFGDLVSETAAYGTVYYAYNTAARLTSVTSSHSDATNPANVFSAAHYNAFGGLTSDTLGDGETESYTYAPHLARLQSYTATLNATTLYNFNIGTFAPNGDILAANDSANGNWTYTYDPFNRLVGSNKNSGQAIYNYVYDRFGNRWQQNGPQTFLATFTGNNPGSPQNNNRMDGYSYDGAGNLKNDGTHNYFYDAENHLIQDDGTFGTCSSATACYVYDADGQRIQRTSTVGDSSEPAGTNVLLYDQSGRLIMTLDSTGATWVQGSIFAGGRHLATLGGNTNFSHSDWLGTERLRTTYAGTVCESIASLPFGDGLTTTGACYHPSPLHFTGKQRDPESGLDNFGARYDSSSMGRFTSPDWARSISPIPYSDISDAQTLNLYAFVGNNPINRKDADGHHEVCDPTTSFVDEAGTLHVVAGKCHEVPDWWQLQGAKNWIRNKASWLQNGGASIAGVISRSLGNWGGDRAGKPFTRSGRQSVIDDNAAANGGQTTCVNCGRPTVPALQSQSGVTPPDNETAVDHIWPQSELGNGEPSNGQLLCRACNGLKSDSLPQVAPWEHGWTGDDKNAEFILEGLYGKPRRDE